MTEPKSLAGCLNMEFEQFDLGPTFIAWDSTKDCYNTYLKRTFELPVSQCSFICDIFPLDIYFVWAVKEIREVPLPYNLSGASVLEVFGPCYKTKAECRADCEAFLKRNGWTKWRWIN